MAPAPLTTGGRSMAGRCGVRDRASCMASRLVAVVADAVAVPRTKRRQETRVAARPRVVGMARRVVRAVVAGAAVAGAGDAVVDTAER